MNERIQALALQAGVFAGDFAGAGLYSIHNRDEVEKFAQLIVAECGVALSPMLRDMVSRGQAFDLIREHFGVES